MPIVAKYNLNGNADAQVGTNGTASSMAWGDGVMNGAGIWNGTNSRISIVNEYYSVDRSVSCFIKSNLFWSFNRDILMMSSDNSASAGNGWGFWIWVDTSWFVTANVVTKIPSVAMYTATSINPISNWLWYHIWAVYNNSTQNIDLYINGVLQQSTSTWNTLRNNPSRPRTNIFADDNSWGFARFFNGSIDELQIYNHALSASEIKNLYSYYKWYYGF